MKPTLSLCLAITKENFLAKDTLDRFHFLFDEIVIVNLLPNMEVNILAYKLGAKLFDQSNSKNLIQAKNFAISKATSDWLLVLDQDERIEIVTSYSFDKLLISTDDVYYLCNTELSSLQDLRPEYSLRLFKRKLKLYFEEIPGGGGEIFYSGLAKTTPDIFLTSNKTLSSPTNSFPIKKPTSFTLSELIGYLDKTKSTEVLGPYLVRLLVEVLLEEKMYAKALIAIEKGLVIYNDFNDLIFLKGICHYFMGQYSLAINTFYGLLSKAATPLYYYSYQGITGHLSLGWLGQLYETVCEHKQAIISYTKALKVCPQNNESVEPLIKNLLKINSFEETIAYLDRHFDFNSPIGITHLAKAFFNLGYYAIAHHYLHELENRSSLSDDLLSLKVFCLIAQSQYEEAGLLLNDFITEDKELKLRNLRDRCIIFWLTNQMNQARKLIDIVKVEDPNNHVYLVLSDLHQILIEGRLSSFKEEEVNLTAYKDELFNLLSLFANLSNGKLLVVAEELLLFKTGERFLVDLAKLYVQRDLLPRAEKALEVLLSCECFLDETYHLLGILHLKQRNFTMATQYFNQALSISPKNHASYLYLSKAFNLKALEVIEKGLKYYPDSELLQIRKEELQKLTEPR